MDFNWDMFKTQMSGQIPLVVIYGVEKHTGGVDLEYSTTDAYELADETLRKDIAAAAVKLGEELSK